MSGKTWVVTSDNPRPSHAAVDGETVALFEAFSNGLQYPGDPNGDPDETAGCTCTMEVDYGGAGAEGGDHFDPTDALLAERLLTGDVKYGEDIPTGVHFTKLGTVDDVPAVIKKVGGGEATQELAAQTINDKYAFVNIPRIVDREFETGPLTSPEHKLISARIDGKSGFDILDDLGKTTSPGEVVADTIRTALEKIPYEERSNLALFDRVIGNLDRDTNYGNWMIGQDGRLYAIDHGVTFAENPVPFSPGFNSAISDTVSRDLSPVQEEKLRAMLTDEKELRKVLGEGTYGGLTKPELDGMFARIRTILDLQGGGA